MSNDKMKKVYIGYRIRFIPQNKIWSELRWINNGLTLIQYGRGTVLPLVKANQVIKEIHKEYIHKEYPQFTIKTIKVFRYVK